MRTTRGRLEGRRIVVTDDNPSTLATISQALRAAEYRVFAAYDGQSALELVVQLGNVDLLVTNTRLGVVRGPELMRRTREFRPDMPIVHIVHDGGEETDLFPDVINLREPVSSEMLLMTVRSLLSHQPVSRLA